MPSVRRANASRSCEWSWQISIIDSIAFVERNVRARVGGTSSRLMVSVSARPSRSEPAAPGCAFSSERGECLERRLRVQRVGVAVRGAHLLRHRRGHRLGEVAFDVADLVELTTLDHRTVEDLVHRGGERLGAVDDDQDRTAHVQAAVAEVTRAAP